MVKKMMEDDRPTVVVGISNGIEALERLNDRYDLRPFKTGGVNVGDILIVEMGSKLGDVFEGCTLHVGGRIFPDMDAVAGFLEALAEYPIIPVSNIESLLDKVKDAELPHNSLEQADALGILRNELFHFINLASQYWDDLGRLVHAKFVDIEAGYLLLAAEDFANGDYHGWRTECVKLIRRHFENKKTHTQMELKFSKCTSVFYDKDGKLEEEPAESLEELTRKHEDTCRLRDELERRSKEAGGNHAFIMAQFNICNEIDWLEHEIDLKIMHINGKRRLSHIE